MKIFKILLLLSILAQGPLPCSAAEDTEEPARNLLHALGCKGCHRLQGEGASLAPELDHIGSRLTHSQIEQHLIAHTTPDKGAFMPSYNTTSPAELKLLSDYLYNLQSH